jgi:hypothetical protein
MMARKTKKREAEDALVAAREEQARDKNREQSGSK